MWVAVVLVALVAMGLTFVATRHGPQVTDDSANYLAGARSLRACDVVGARAGVRVDDAEWGRLLLQMRDDAREHGVLDNVREIPGVKGVAIVHRHIIQTSS